MAKNYYTYIFEEYERYYGTDRVDIVGWEPSGKSEIVVYYADGVRVRYDSMSKSVYSVHPRKTDNRFVDDEIYIQRFSWKLRAVMNGCGLSREEISERTGISKSALSSYATGRKVPGALNIYKLANVLNCSVEDLLNVGDWDR